MTAPACYGPRVTAIVLYLYVGQFLSKKRAAGALAELFGTPVCEGTVAAVTGRAAARLGAFTALVRDRIAAADVAHFDETGLRTGGRLRWVHSASTGKYSLITVHDKRGVAGMDAAGVLPAFTGVAVHDAWAPYDTYQQAHHGLCNAHLLRELQAVVDQTADGQWCWAAQAADALRKMKKLIDATVSAGDTNVDAEALARHVHAFRSAVTIGQAQTRALHHGRAVHAETLGGLPLRGLPGQHRHVQLVLL